MFKKLFFKNVEEKEEEKVFENVDPVVVQRRKEKFSTPLIYDEEIIEEENKPKEVKPVKKETKKETIPYEMSQIISPIGGVKKSKVEDYARPKPAPKKPKKRKIEDQLVPVISPFYGMTDLEKDDVKEEKLEIKEKSSEKKNETVKEVIPTKEIIVEKEETVESNLRNIASIIEEEKDQLRIIEERTGEFKLDFSNQGKDTFIDEIDDSMSLDELMSLYEKKFKD